MFWNQNIIVLVEPKQEPMTIPIFRGDEDKEEISKLKKDIEEIKWEIKECHSINKELLMLVQKLKQVKNESSKKLKKKDEEI